MERGSKPLTEALLETEGAGRATRRNPLLGLVLVTSAALLFGVVAACVKAITSMSKPPQPCGCLAST